MKGIIKFNTRIAINPFPKINSKVNNHHTIIAIAVFINALILTNFKQFISFFSLENTINENPPMKRSKISSSVKLVVKTENSFVSRNDE